LRAELHNLSIDKRNKKLEDSDVIIVIKRQIKRHQDSIDQFKKGQRQDLVDKETKELEILESYLPKQLSEEEIRKVVEEVVSSSGAKDIKDMGKVMKEVMAKIGDSADGKIISNLVKEKLSPPKQ